MKRIALVSALLGAIVLAFAGVAMAGTGGNPNYGSSGSGGFQNKGTLVNHYTASYTDSFFGGVKCTGVNQMKGSSMQESFTCTSSTGQPLTNVTAGQVINWGAGMWLSDYNHSSLDKSFTATVSADGMSYSAVATY